MIVDAHEALAVLRAQHRAIDLLMARLIVADPTFRPTQCREIWDVVKQGHDLMLSLEAEIA